MSGRGSSDGASKPSKGAKPKGAKGKEPVNKDDSVVLVVTTGEQSTKKRAEDVCQTCGITENKPMVQCDMCDGWSHFICVGVTEEVKDQSWICLKCQSAKENQPTIPSSCLHHQRVPHKQTSENVATDHNDDPMRLRASTSSENAAAGQITSPTIRSANVNVPVVVIEPASDAHSSHSGNKSRSSKSSQSLLKLQLMKLNEERAFEEAEAAKFREYLKEKYRLLEQMTNRTESSRSEDGSRVRKWVNNVNDVFQDERVGGGGDMEPFNPTGHSTTNPQVARPRPIFPSSNKIQNSTPLYGDRSPPAAIAESFSRSVRHTSTAPSGNYYHEPAPSHRRAHDAHHPMYSDHHGGVLRDPSVSSRHRHLQGQSSVVEDPWSLTRSQLAARQAVPKDLPMFAGSPEEWPVFISMFNSSTSMCGYSNEENVIRLQKSLKGKAYDAVKCRLMHPSNVPGVMDTLRLLFGQPEAIVHSLITKIDALPPVREDKLEALVDLAVNVQNFCATVDACGLDDYMYNVSLLHQLVNKLPPTIRLDWARYRQTIPRTNMATFGNWLYSLAEAASALSIPPLIQDHKLPKPEIRQAKKASMFIHTQSNSDELPENPDECLLCKGCCKSVVSCRDFLDLPRDSKWAAVRNLSLCRTCLQRHEGRCRGKPCGKNGCSYYHHELLHNDKKMQPSVRNSSLEQAVPQELQRSSNSPQGCNTHQSDVNKVLFRYIPVVLDGKKGSIRTYAFFDEGSAMTLLDQELADQLDISGPIHPLGLRWTGGTERCEKNSQVVNLLISGTHSNAAKYQLNGVRTVNELMLPYQSLDMEHIGQTYPYCRNLPVESYSNVRPQILIGSKHASIGLVLKSREGNLDQPIAVKTRLGWTIYGGCNHNDTPNLVQYSFHICEGESELENLHQTVKDYFALDSIGISKTSKELLSSDNQRALSLLKNCTRFNGRQFETALLWRYENSRLPDNKEMALRRYLCLEKRLQKDQELAKTLKLKMEEYLSKGYIRKLLPTEHQKHYPRIWYLPIFPVFNVNKPGKLRIVWDGAAKYFGISLNSALLTGPDQLCSLFSILLQFRENAIGVTGDIREMFHQVLIRKEDQQCQRFFWRDESGEMQVFVMNVMTFGASCSPACAQYVKNLNADRFSAEYPEAVGIIKHKHYVDDAMFSTETPSQAIQLAQEIRQIHSAGGFEIRNWVSNSKQVLSALNEDYVEERSLDLTQGPMATEKVLGMWWCTATDEFIYKIQWERYGPELLKGAIRPTKRQMLQVLMSIFDPLGLISHYLMYLKVLLQEVWRSGIQWDEGVDSVLFEKWCKWLGLLPKIEIVKIPRWFRSTTMPSSCEMQMHTFVDASENGMAATTFLRFVQDNKVMCTLAAAKTRVAPIRFHSIPRLELQAAIVGARLSQSVLASLSSPIRQRFFWTDSRDVLSWINSDHRRYSTFVAFRVSEILDISEPNNWRWVPSRQNVADDGTKWEKYPDLSSESRWFNGPDFLYRCEAEWPVIPEPKTNTNVELRSAFVSHHTAVESLVDPTRFSSWTRLTNVVAFVYRFVTNCRQKVRKQPIVSGPLTMQELQKAEGHLFRQAQYNEFHDEMELLARNRNQTQTNPLPKNSRLYKLSPWIDDAGIMRMRSRLSACQYVSEATKKPVILPKNSHVTTLLITHYHTKFNHQNHETVINEIRQKFVISHLRSRYRTVRTNCQFCKNERTSPQPPLMADLPTERLAAFSRPFTHVGIDFFGPMEIVIGRRKEKRWGMIVICLTTRAVHVELANSLSTDSCIIAIRNFIARRGTPRSIRSDRGTNFIGASRILDKVQKAYQEDQIMKEIVNAETSWTFNPPLSPHMGGSWERLIRSLKRNLMAICPSRTPTEDVLRNLLIEVESTLNARPLTHVPIDDEESPAITPNHFLLGSSNGSKPLVPLDDSAALLKQNWRTSQALAAQFWKRWISEYLPEITRRTKWYADTKPIAIDDIVIIVDPNLPRNCWPRGRIVATHIGKDGRIRSATVRTTNATYERPVTKLAVLDVRRDGEQVNH